LDVRAPLRDGEVLAFHVRAPDRPTLRVRALRPTLHPALADAVEARHREALRHHGVEGVAPISPLRSRSATWLAVAEAPDAGCVGGVRVDLRGAAQPLPLEQVLMDFGADQVARLRDGFIGRVGELAGLWVREDFRGLGLAGALIAAGVVAARRAGLTRLFTLASRHMRATCDAQGFEVLRALGDDGAFQYPDARYLSFAMALDLKPDAADRSSPVCSPATSFEETLR